LSICDKDCHIIKRIESDSFEGYASIHESCEGNIREGNIREEEQWAKMNISRKRSSYIEKDCLKKSHNHFSTGDSRAEYSS
jgi:hypothetical protein